MRVVAGQLRGRRLHTLKAQTGGLRPTTDRAREGLFNWLGPRFAGASVLDLFAGTGALGIEALSRGADSATYVEKNRATAMVLRRNLDDLVLGERARVLVRDVRSAVPELRRSGASFDLILADPPYARSSGADWSRWLLEEAGLKDLLEPAGTLVIERAREREHDGETPFLVHRASKIYGGTAFDWYDAAAGAEA